MKSVALSWVKDDLSKYLRLAAQEEVIITRHDKAAVILIGFASEDDWFDYRLENDPRFMRRITDARASLRSGHGIRLFTQQTPSGWPHQFGVRRHGYPMLQSGTQAEETR